ncbi:pyruvate/2-oxoglutarate dehydrogenase complex dihydrolipoamide dehydrogenase (E3) component [Vibrio crassostreae]|uniref:NAD(P)/FAD-dependent oxidoreductase n=1 Tax=Vibrio crassostreae TaxID=246167 RepID=UPI00105233B2|nr:NAD(P)/FAD-dependent oxidoreductase [Vibrio crassostreae]MBY7731406.1 FAD-dependent oxidoreductase [Vibrio splendidus]TCW11011.1 pyruvate/2-oxoglutarate dehydrogenase complex dihydrolipoamide dehydrogenase (E3) component [Vibrio crassostreae]TQK40343.1 pyruvate/2-oxoglutarate dehydrogenase complex dihydrolipoamide dehydrogenase (E3) component [Vibrio crassostreae]TWD33254.1 pyruvate/2-oxoglutarate dehydrogenase complex dihydrolipoamide dehydrogenase (E3) component [Vibrio crassostreae]CAK18
MLEQSNMNFDVCVIGSGPAGMAAAVQCSMAGANVMVIDEQARPGGQIYRAIQESGHPHGHIFGPDYLRGAELVKTFNQANISYFSGATLWRIDSDSAVYWSRDGKAQKATAKKIIIATGAIERPFPFSGWTLPGVMTAGACQIMMKTSGIVPKDAILVGTGPLLYLLAVQMSDAGATPKAIVDTQQSANYFKAAGYWLNAWQGRNYIAKGLTLLSKIHRLGIKRYTSSTHIEALGSQRLEGLTFQSSGRTVELKGETVLAHIGVIPNVQLTRAMGLEHVWDSLQVCWKPKLDSNNMSSRYGVFVAGDSGGIGGALVAELQGELVAQNTLQDLELNGNLINKNNDNPIKAIINKELSVRPFLDALYTPPKQALTPSDQTIVCRCEEVTAKQIRDHVDQGTCGINQIKTFTRCGMGPCQGRHCGSTVAHIISDKVGISMEKVGYYRLRNPIKPLKLGELASLTPAKSSFIKKYNKGNTKYEQDTETVY